MEKDRERPGQPSTRRAILDALTAEPAGLGVGELAARVGLHPNAIRRHVPRLLADGAIVSAREAPQGRGRPGARYRLAPAEAEDAGRREVTALLVRLLVEQGVGAAQAEALGRVHGRELGGAGVDADGLAAHLAAMGFAPVDETPAAAARAGGVELRLGRCPFRDAVEVRGGGIVCALHRGLTAGLIESSGGALEDFEVVDPVHAGCRVVARGLRREARPG